MGGDQGEVRRGDVCVCVTKGWETRETEGEGTTATCPKLHYLLMSLISAIDHYCVSSCFVGYRDHLYLFVC